METTEMTDEMIETPMEPCPVLKPFIKIPGGKRKLLKEIFAHFPEDFFEDEYNYIEPMLGGGAVALEVLRMFENIYGEAAKRPKVVLNDKNSHIQNLWNMTIEDPDAVLSRLDIHLTHHSEEYYYKVRERFPSLHSDPTDYGLNDLAADFLYLNKNCFNGLIRYNKQGIFNSPVGKYNKVQGVDKAHLRNISKYLYKGHVHTNDFQEFFEGLLAHHKGLLTDKTLVYIDPPYVPLTLTSNFTDYTPNGFTQYDQLRLKMIIGVLTNLGVKVILSNSSAQWVYDTYAGYNIYEIEAARAINSVGTKRGKVKELIITNFL